MTKKIKIIPLGLSLIAGMGHLWEGKDLKGLMIFSFFAAAAAGLVEGAVLWSGDGRLLISLISLGIMLAVWGYAFFDIFRMTYGPWIEKNRLKRSEQVRQGILGFLRNDYDLAERAFMNNLQLTPGDSESLFRLAVICRRRGAFTRARRYLNQLRKTDMAEKWRWEGGQELMIMQSLESREKEKEAQQEALCVET